MSRKNNKNKFKRMHQCDLQREKLREEKKQVAADPVK